MILYLLVLLRIVSNPLSNLFQKRLTARAADPVFLMAVTYGALAVLSLPLLWWNAPTVDVSFWLNAAILAVVDVLGNVLLVLALERSEMSIFGPLNAWKAVVSLAFAAVLIHEIPSVRSLGGVALIVTGSILLTRTEATAATGPRHGVPIRLLSLLVLSLAAVFLKKLIMGSSPLYAFAWWAIGSAPVAIAVSFVRRRPHQKRIMREYPGDYFWLILTFGIAQICVVFTFRALPVGVALALFQISTLLTIFFGHRYFEERGIRRRMLAAAIMMTGAVLAAWQ